jgi:hypothetical protein
MQCSLSQNGVHEKILSSLPELVVPYKAHIKTSIKYVGILVGIDEPYVLRVQFLYTCNIICIGKNMFHQKFHSISIECFVSNQWVSFPPKTFYKV